MSDGQKREETGFLKDFGDLKIWTVEGFYEYESTDGTTFKVEYLSDDKGYHSEVSQSRNTETPIIRFPVPMFDDGYDYPTIENEYHTYLPMQGENSIDPILARSLVG